MTQELRIKKKNHNSYYGIHHSDSRGQSVIEVIVAVAILTIIAATGVIAILGSLSTTRLAEEESQATLVAVEGIEAVQSIRNQDWDSLTNGNHGISNAGGTWAFSGSSDTDSSGTFTRVITVEDVQRDSNADIVSSDGTTDEDTKLITSAVSWSFTPTRSNTVSFVQYLTDWQRARNSGGGGVPTLNTCSDYCATLGFTLGTCRGNAQQCTNNSEEYRPQGDNYCIGGASEDTCCCAS